MANKRVAMKYYEGGLSSSEIEELPWYEWHLILVDIAEARKKQLDDEKKQNGGKSSSSEPYDQAQRMMQKNSAGLPKPPNFKMPSMPK